MMNPEFRNLLQSTIGIPSISKGIPESQFNEFIQNAISIKYNEVDCLRLEISELKSKHVDEILELKLKLSNLIDTNYSLLQELRKQNVNSQAN